MLVMIILGSLVMATAMAVVDGGRLRRDGLLLWSLVLLLNAIVHGLFALRGLVPDGLSIVLANALLACVFSTVTAAVLQFQGRALRWPLLLAPALLLAVGLVLYSDNFNARVILVGLVCSAQVLGALWILLQRRQDSVGRGMWLLAIGLALEVVILLSRAAAATLSPAPDAGSLGILQSTGLQTLSFFATFSVVLFGSLGFVFMLRDRADERNRFMAAHDALTGVANRRALVTALNRDVARAARSGQPIAVLMVDIDHFKRVNDRYGHPVGDQVLCHVVQVLSQRVRSQDLVGRYGGEEFMVVLPDTTLQGAEQLAQALRQAVAQAPCHITTANGHADHGAQVAVTVSIGVFGGSVAPDDSWDMLIAAADRALYQAKENGRNRVEVSTTLRHPDELEAA